MPAIAAISSVCDSRSTLIIRSVPMLPDPITATFITGPPLKLGWLGRTVR